MYFNHQIGSLSNHQINFMQTDNGRNLIVELSFSFALKIIKYAERLEGKRKYIISRQLLRAGTSIGATVREAQMQKVKPTLFIN